MSLQGSARVPALWCACLVADRNVAGRYGDMQPDVKGKGPLRTRPFRASGSQVDIKKLLPTGHADTPMKDGTCIAHEICNLSREGVSSSNRSGVILRSAPRNAAPDLVTSASLAWYPVSPQCIPPDILDQVGRGDRPVDAKGTVPYNPSMSGVGL